MSWSEEIDLRKAGVRLPSDEWIHVPGSPFQVRTRGTDPVGVFHVRIRPSYSAYWVEFMSDKEAGADAVS
jgi:hypothetical protein